MKKKKIITKNEQSIDKQRWEKGAMEYWVAGCRENYRHRRDAKDAEITKGNNNFCTSSYNEYLYCCP